MQQGGLRGCDSCSALLYAHDVFCPTCGAGVQEAQTAAGKVRIPMRRHGVVPMADGPEMAAEPRGGAARSAILGLALTLLAASATAAVLYRLW